jgi:hypothetical protein
MLNVVTVHWQSPQWVDVQLRYLTRNVDIPWRVFASLNGIDKALWDRFHFAAELDGDHADKLNELADIVASHSPADDYLMFIDGDAFPIRPMAGWMTELLSSHQLAALRRDENLGDPQPHPAFCLTTVGFWKDIEGDWRSGPMWENQAGMTTDVGGRVLRTLQESDIPWRPILRSNTTNLHPVWFGVYEHRIYHHGAGFRPRVSRLDILRDPNTYASVDPIGPPTITSRPTMAERARTAATGLRSPNGSDVRAADAVRGWTRRRRGLGDERRRERRLRQDERQAARVFSWIADDEGDFYLRLDRAAND